MRRCSSWSSRGVAVAGELLGELDGLDQAALVGDALAGDVEGCAVIDRGPDDRQPRVTFTPERSIHLPVAGSISKPSSFTGMCPWSWYIATTASYWPARSFTNTVSPGTGPWMFRPSALALSITGVMTSISSRPNSPPSPACGFSAAMAIFGLAIPSPFRGLVGEVDHEAQALRRQALRHVLQRDVGGDVRDPHVAVGEHHHRAAHPGQLGQHLGMAGIVVAGLVEGLLVERRRDDAADLVRHRQTDAGLDRLVGEAAAIGGEPARLDGRALGIGLKAAQGRPGSSLGHLGDPLRQEAQCLFGPAQGRDAADDHELQVSGVDPVLEPRGGLDDDLGPMPAGSPMVMARWWVMCRSCRAESHSGGGGRAKFRTHRRRPISTRPAGRPIVRRGASSVGDRVRSAPSRRAFDGQGEAERLERFAAGDDQSSWPGEIVGQSREGTPRFARRRPRGPCQWEGRGSPSPLRLETDGS